jgi:hypothetical protein
MNSQHHAVRAARAPKSRILRIFASIATVLAMLGAVAWSAPTFAQAWPNRPIRFLVPNLLSR